MTLLELGFDEAGEGPVLLLVHGFPLDRTMWSAQLEGLSDIRRVVAVDLRGRGSSPDPAEAPEEPPDEPGWTMDTHADDLARLVDTLGAEPIDLGGLSMGGYVAFAFLRRHPGKLRSLILMSTRAAADTPETKQVRERSAALAREKGTAALAETTLPRLTAPGPTATVRAKLEAMLLATPAATAAADLLAMRDRPDSTSDLASISVPTLVLHGEEDALIPLNNARAMAEAIPGASLALIPGAGHMAPVEDPAAANAYLRDFLTP